MRYGQHPAPRAKSETDQANLRPKADEPRPVEGRSEDGQRTQPQKPSEKSVGDIHTLALCGQPLIRSSDRDEHQARHTESELEAD